LDTDALAAVRPILASGSSCVVFDACEYFLDTAVTDAGSRAYVHELLRVTVPHLRSVTCVNSAIEQRYRQALPSFPPTIIVGNTTTLHRTTTRDASPLRFAARAAATDYLALFHGGFSARRGLNQLAIAARDLQPPWRIVLLGAGPLQQSLEQVAARAPQLTILPRVGLEALAEWLCGADLGLIPYEAGPVNHDLATPNKLYEFPAVGVPLAVTDLQLVSAIVRGNALGVVFRDAAYATELVAWMNSGAAAQYVAPDQAKARALAGFVASNHWHQDERRIVDLFANLERYPAKAR
jgi:glycosyltransferase involved in cell wall biosynthesis